MSLDPLSKAIERAAADRQKQGRSTTTIKPNIEVQKHLEGVSEKGSIARTKIISPSPTAWATIRPGRDAVGKAAQTSFEVLSTRVTQWLESEAQNELIITSPSDSNGKTNTAVNLALTIAASSNKNVLLVDLDLHNPSIHKAFGYKIQHGIVDLIQGEKTFDDVAINPGVPGIVIIPGGSASAVSAEVLTGSRIKQFAQEIKLRYPDRIVIFDMPPVLGSADVLAFIPVVRNYLLVVEAGKNTRKQLNDCVHILDHGHMVGTVLNRSSEYESAYS